MGYAGLLAGFCAVAGFAQTNDLPKRTESSSVVRIETWRTDADCRKPWQMKTSESMTGSGFVIEGRRILTVARVVEGDVVCVKVGRPGDPERWPAKVRFVDRGSDLAVLSVDDERFFESVPAVRIQDVVPSGQSITAVGYPSGEETPYFLPGSYDGMGWGFLDGWIPERLPYGEVTLSWTAGFGGAPVFLDEAVIGVFSDTEDSDGQKIVRMIPAELVERFLKDIADGRFDGFGMLGSDFERLESPTKRKLLGMTNGMSGVLLKPVRFGTSDSYPLRTNDVVLAIDGIQVSNAGKVIYKGFPMNMRVLFSAKQAYETVRLEILRDKQVLTVDVVLEPGKFAVPTCRERPAKEYYIAGGLVFRALDGWYLRYMKETEGDSGLWSEGDRRWVSWRPETVVLSTVLPDETTEGFNGPQDCVVTEVNGIPIRDLRHLAERVETCQDPFIVFRTQSKSREVGDGSIVLESEKLRTATERILKSHKIQSRASSGLSDVLRN